MTWPQFPARFTPAWSQTYRALCSLTRPFPKGTPLLADAEQVLKYIPDYGKGVLHLVRFRHQVIDVSAKRQEDGPYWRLKVLNLNNRTVLSLCYDAAVVSNGRYNKIYEPSIPGIDDWKRLDPRSVLHSKRFRDAKEFEAKKVVIVGFSSSGSSGVDVDNVVAPLSAQTLLISQKSSVGVFPGAKSFEQGKVILPPIIELNAKRRSVLFANEHEESSVDCIIFWTGYDYEYPFLSGVRGFGPGRSDGNTLT
ncbi:Flavin-containing monooxygenase FMO GS-OX-like 3 [Beauveria bassiana]|nr:Flavin-containing monooxygenase FMO GS-OX-like 3 [Beauveria bassiana]